MRKYVLDRKIWSWNPAPLTHHLCVVHGQTDRVRRNKIGRKLKLGNKVE